MKLLTGGPTCRIQIGILRPIEITHLDYLHHFDDLVGAWQSFDARTN